MKTTKKILLVLILLLPVLLLTSCDDADLDLLAIALEAWAEENGLYKDGKFSPFPMAQKVAEDTIGGITNGEPFVQLDGLDVVRDIEKADKLASSAIEFNEPEKMAAAIQLRPEDWRLQEQNAVLWLYNSNSSAASNAQTKADDLLKDSVKGTENCAIHRKQQLEFREREIRNQIPDCEKTAFCTLTVLEEALISTSSEIQSINASGTTPFCGD